MITKCDPSNVEQKDCYEDCTINQLLLKAIGRDQSSSGLQFYYEETINANYGNVQSGHQLTKEGCV